MCATRKMKEPILVGENCFFRRWFQYALQYSINLFPIFSPYFIIGGTDSALVCVCALGAGGSGCNATFRCCHLPTDIAVCFHRPQSECRFAYMRRVFPGKSDGALPKSNSDRKRLCDFGVVALEPPGFSSIHQYPFSVRPTY